MQFLFVQSGFPLELPLPRFVTSPQLFFRSGIPHHRGSARTFTAVRISRRSYKKSHIVVVACVAILFGASIQLLKFKGGWWVDTCLCIPAGMLFCSLRTKIESIIRIIPIPVWLIGILTTLFGVIFYRYSIVLFGLYGPNIGAITFATGITLIFSAVNFKSLPSFLHWSGGSALFYLYIFQRLPMLIGYRLGWNTQSPYLYEAFCFCITTAIAFVCVQIFPRTDNRIVSFLKKDVNSCS